MSKVITIGRSNNNDIVLAYPQISRNHAEITLVDKDKLQFGLRDLDTLNGTYKNGEKIHNVIFDSQKDKIMVGHINIRPSLYLPYFFEDSPLIPVEGSKTVIGSDLGNITRITGHPVSPSPAVGDSRNGVQRPSKQDGARTDGAVVPTKRKRWLEAIARREIPYYLVVFLLGAGFATAVIAGLSASVIYSLVGYCALLAILASISYATMESMRRFAYQKTQQAISLELLEEKVNTVRVQRIEKERSQYAWNGYRKFVVSRKIKESEDVYSIYLSPHDKKPLPAFKPGQYLTIGLKINHLEKPIIRCYSLSCSSVDVNEFRISVKKLPHGTCSSYLHEHLQEGDILDVRAPSGNFLLDISAGTPIVLIAGGIGITPLLSMLNTLVDLGSRREVWIFYGVTNGTRIIQPDHFIGLASTHPNFHLHLCFSRPLETDPNDDIHFRTRITIDFLKETLGSNNYEFYLCGPGEMMHDIREGLSAWGVPKKHIHFEGFGPATLRQISTPSPSAAKVVAEHTVHFSRSGKSCAWKPDSGSILNLARVNSINIETGCEAGNCGTCIVAIRKGEVSYLSEPGAMPEKGSCLTCIAIPEGELVIDA